MKKEITASGDVNRFLGMRDWVGRYTDGRGDCTGMDQ